MGMIGDLSEAGGLWKKTPFSIKCILILNSVLALSPLASLADTIVTWVSFFKSAVEFHNNHIQLPLLNFLGQYGLSLSTAEVNVIIIICLMMASYFRILKSAPNHNEAVVVFIATAVLIIKFGGEDTSLDSNMGTVRYFLYLGGAIVIYCYMANQVIKSSFENKLAFFGPPVLGMILFCIGVGINEALKQL